MSLKHLDEYRAPDVVRELLRTLSARAARRAFRFMEICGTHTVALFRSGLRGLLPENLTLVSGPGCPVCVTAQGDIDLALRAARTPGVILATYGDLVRVPGSGGSLADARGDGADVRVVYGSREALALARENPEREVVLAGIGFETTAPTVAAAVMEAARDGLENFGLLSFHKLLPPAMKALLSGGELRLDGFLCPGHVAMVIGAKAFEPVVSRHRMPCVVAGFEPADILLGLSALAAQVEAGEARVENLYPRAVSWNGNPAALRVMDEVFTPADASWRGLGVIPESGLALSGAYRRFDARARLGLEAVPTPEPPGCRCGEVLRGAMTPPGCPLFRRACTPETPLGPCMVSSEGTCGAYYRYHRE